MMVELELSVWNSTSRRKDKSAKGHEITPSEESTQITGKLLRQTFCRKLLAERWYLRAR